MSVAVIGGGVSGIAAAFYLSQAGIDVDLYEASSFLGGRIAPRKLGNRWVDMGGKNIGLKYHYFREFLNRIGISDFEYFGLNSSQTINGKTINLNKDKNSLHSAIQIIQRIGIRGIHYLLLSACCIKIDRSQGFINTKFFNKLSEYCDNNPLSYYFSPKTNKYLIRLLTVRMNGAEPDECYLGNIGSNFSLLMDNYEQLRDGMHTWIERFCLFSNRTKIKTDCAVHSLSKNNKKIELFINNESVKYDHVVIALPASRTSRLIRNCSPQLADLLDEIRYYPVATAVVEYERNVFKPETRAMVFPSSSPLSNAGAYGIHDLRTVRYTFSGKEARSIFLQNKSNIEMLDLAENFLFTGLNIQKIQRVNHAYQYIKDGLCAYSPFHHKKLARFLAEIPENISLTGDYWRGASIEACFFSAYEATKRIINESKIKGTSSC